MTFFKLLNLHAIPQADWKQGMYCGVLMTNKQRIDLIRRESLDLRAVRVNNELCWYQTSTSITSWTSSAKRSTPALGLHFSRGPERVGRNYLVEPSEVLLFNNTYILPELLEAIDPENWTNYERGLPPNLVPKAKEWIRKGF